jgi:hypothetical protein
LNRRERRDVPRVETAGTTTEDTSQSTRGRALSDGTEGVITVTAVLSVRRANTGIVRLALLLGLVLSVACPLAKSAEISRATPAEPEPLRQPPDQDVQQQRVVVDPNENRGDWEDRHEGWFPGGPRIQVWVDRGEWGTYRQGEPLFVFFRVDRPCYVTIIDYSPNGREEVLFPNRWSGTNFAQPGVVYRIPDSRRYSLRIVGPGGEETLVACAHQALWPGLQGDTWHPPYRPSRGRVVVGRPGGLPQPGRHGRVVVGPPQQWPVPSEWWEHHEQWGCDAVSFYVEGAREWWGEGEGDYDLFHEVFTMTRCSDSFSRDVSYGRVGLVIAIECTESRNGNPTEIVGRLSWSDGWRGEELFRLDAEGVHGELPTPGRVFVQDADGLRLEARIADVAVGSAEHGGPARIERITFEVTALED